MRMPPEGRPFVTPQPLCPANQQGNIPDLEAADFLLTVDFGEGRPTDVGGEFFIDEKEDEPVDFIETDTMQLPPDPSLLQRVLELTYAKTGS
ncbi:MAG TPA: hypothetical protein VFT59_05180, partial [Candidatus Saccharimonadales bacterium]|nr:hypothetical protein [Candidatus Saccharimonadales bacterium]